MAAPKTPVTSTWTPPVRDPSFARWLENLLESNDGLPLEPHELVGQLSEGSGFSPAELCDLFGYPANYYDAPEGEGEDSDGDED